MQDRTNPQGRKDPLREHVPWLYAASLFGFMSAGLAFAAARLDGWIFWPLMVLALLGVGAAGASFGLYVRALNGKAREFESGSE